MSDIEDVRRTWSAITETVTGYAVRLAAVTLVPSAVAVSAVVWAITGQGPAEAGRLGLAAATTALPVAVAYLYGRRTAEHLSSIEGSARRLAIGDDTVAVEVDRRDEIGDLGGAVVAVRDAFAARVREAERSHQQAQREVAADYCEAIRECGEGDLSVRLDPDRAEGGLRAVARAFNDAMDRLEFAAADLSGLGEDTAAGTRRVEDGSRELLAAGDRVLAELDHTRETAARRLETQRRVAEDTTELSRTASRIAERAAEARSVAERGVGRARTTGDLAEETADAVQRAGTEATTADREIAHLASVVEEVETLATRLSRLGTTANRAALNATIAASSDGDDLDVTDDLEDLAGETRQAAEDAETLAAELRSQTATAETAIRDVQSALSDGEEAATATATAAEEGRSAAESVATVLGDLEAAATHHDEASSEVVRLADEATESAESVRERANRAIDAVDEHLAAVGTLVDWSRALTERAAELETALGTLETDRRETGPGADAARDRAAPIADGGSLLDGSPLEATVGDERERDRGTGED